ncbi:hypothetical protein [Arthrobacter sp. MP_2.3]|uniref:hypothetical protein n=1 Tax=Arthrobacter sp. MP_2.3 TaxID=3349633 RepID=UPI0038D3EA0A
MKQTFTGPLLYLFILGDVLGAGVYALLGNQPVRAEFRQATVAEPRHPVPACALRAAGGSAPLPVRPFRAGAVTLA